GIAGNAGGYTVIVSGGFRVLALLVLPALVATAGRAPLPNGREFLHGNHVQLQWLDRTQAEVARDCRGCHRYVKGEPPRDPQQVCGDCHFPAGYQGTFEMQAAAGYEKDFAPLRAAGSPEFTHVDHETMACRECHYPEGGRFAGENEALPIRRGAGECDRCHGPKPTDTDFEAVAGRTIDKADLHDRLIKHLNASPNMKAAAPGAFRHVDHLTNPRASFALSDVGKAQDACSLCHRSVAGAAARGLGGGLFEVEACGTCHRDAAGPLAFTTAPQPASSRSAMTFAHRDHLTSGRKPGVCDDAGYQLIADGACSACHAFDPIHAPAGHEWLVQVAGSAEAAFEYEGCVVCHTLEEWRTDRHGEWDTCTKCHTFGKGEMKTNRPTATVSRVARGRFAILSHAHPYITAAGNGLDDCRECHRAPVPELASRLHERPFRHSTHLPLEPTDKDCQKCHAAVTGQAASGTLGYRLQGQQAYRSYDLGACAECHTGGGVVPLETAASERSVVEFDHTAHFGKPSIDGPAMTCGSCHDPRNDLGAVDTALQAAMQCTGCHDHDAAGRHWQKTGKINGTAVTSCVRCHRETVPPIRAELGDPRLELVRVSGAQHHPPQQKCGECHRVGPVDFPADRENHLLAIGGFDATGHKDRHKSGKEPNCFGCHWIGWLAGMSGDDRQWAIARSTLGGDLENYPGADAARMPGR
ncbi:MAG: cytochrome c3 family protein, partial [Mycobacterium sp.]